MKNLLPGLLLFIVLPLTLSAALPAAVDGQTLPSLAPMLEKITPAVVNIATRGKSRRRIEFPIPSNPLFKRFFNVPSIDRIQETSSLGSGVIVDAEHGLILTNNHVIKDAYQINVTLTDGRELNAEIIGRDPDTDVAVIQVPAEDLVQVPMADSGTLRVGDFVVAIGNPFGLGQTVTSGIVSALGRSGLGIESIEDFIQTDASINVGNSGGALVNLRGELVGINTAIYGAGNQGNIGIGFAIPVNMARDIMKQLIDFGEVKATIGQWIDDHWDHATILWDKDTATWDAVANLRGQRVASMSQNPTAEHMADVLLREVCPMLLDPLGVTATSVVVWETPKCRAEATL